MREVEQLEISYHKKGWVSVFIGICQSRAQLEAYLEKDYERLGVDDIGCEMGIDFGINTYDEDFSVIAFKKSSQNTWSCFYYPLYRICNSLCWVWSWALGLD